MLLVHSLPGCLFILAVIKQKCREVCITLYFAPGSRATTNMDYLATQSHTSWKESIRCSWWHILGKLTQGRGGWEALGQAENLVPPLFLFHHLAFFPHQTPSPQMQHQLVALLLLTRFHCFCCLFKNFWFCSCSVAKWGMQGREATARELHNSEASRRVDGVT